MFAKKKEVILPPEQIDRREYYQKLDTRLSNDEIHQAKDMALHVAPFFELLDTLKDVETRRLPEENTDKRYKSVQEVTVSEIDFSEIHQVLLGEDGKLYYLLYSKEQKTLLPWPSKQPKLPPKLNAQIGPRAVADTLYKSIESAKENITAQREEFNTRQQDLIKRRAVLDLL